MKSWKAEHVWLSAEIINNLSHHLDNKIPWINLKSPQTLFTIQINGIIREEDEQNEFLEIQYGNNEQQIPYLAAYLHDGEGPISMVAVFTNIFEYIVLNYTKGNKSYVFKLVSYENPY